MSDAVSKIRSIPTALSFPLQRQRLSVPMHIRSSRGSQGQVYNRPIVAFDIRYAAERLLGCRANQCIASAPCCSIWRH